MLVHTYDPSLDSLKQALAAVAPEALLVDPWIMRRVIRMDRRLTGLGWQVPHRDVYTIPSSRLLAFVDRPELEVEATKDLPAVVILLRRPLEDDFARQAGDRNNLLWYWRLLFHARLHLQLEHRYADPVVQQSIAAARWSQLGETEHQEVEAVLLHDGLLFPEPTAWETYVEFTAVYFELKHFAPRDIPLYFPALADLGRVEATLIQDIEPDACFQQTRLADAPFPNSSPVDDLRSMGRASSWRGPSPDTPAAMTWIQKWSARATRASQVGNHVRSAMSWWKAAEAAPKRQATAMRGDAERELRRVIDPLDRLVGLTPEEVVEWSQATLSLLERAVQSNWSTEARLLYDLQKACVESESGVFRADLFGWLSSLGRKPWNRPLPLLPCVLLARHLRAAERRLSKTQLAASDRQRFSVLMSRVAERAEERLRNTIRPIIHTQMDDVGLVPTNVPERVARNKLVEELLDHLVDHGYLNTGTFRDALSKGDLKLPDVSGLRELLVGDQLLRADRKLASALDGVYRPAAIYLRWTQRLSSLAFGTPFGRFLTLYLVLPFGGAYLALEGASHAASWLLRHELAIPDQAMDIVKAEQLAAKELTGPPGWLFYTTVVALGSFVFLLMHRPRFRQACARGVKWLGSLLRTILFELPRSILRIPIIDQLFHSPAYAMLRGYGLKPALLTLLVFLATRFLPLRWSSHVALDVFLLSALFLNSPIGRHADEWFTDVLVRGWEDLRIRVVGVVFQRIMNAFHRLLTGLNHLLYALDEWSRFRARDVWLVKMVKLLTGTIWAAISYVIVFVSTLLIEPQINPIKHFPVVTVAHKLILPTGPLLVRQLSPYLGITRATTLVWSTIWLIPGVFGFLVWELKENWRLYVANRSRLLASQPIGRHGETMAGLLRPSFHSGTLPKLFARIRRAARKAQEASDARPLQNQQALLGRVEQSVRQFLERDLAGLLAEAGVRREDPFRVREIRLATNRVEATVGCDALPGAQLKVTWDEVDGCLTGRVTDEGMLSRLPHDQCQYVKTALTGLFQRTGVDEVQGPWGGPAKPPYFWRDWVSQWG